MMPDEVTAIIVKVFFVLSASVILMMSRVRAAEVNHTHHVIPSISTTLN